MVINYSLNYTPLSAITKLHISVISLEVCLLLIFSKKNPFAPSLVPFLESTVILLKQCLPSSNLLAPPKKHCTEHYNKILLTPSWNKYKTTLEEYTIHNTHYKLWIQEWFL